MGSTDGEDSKTKSKAKESPSTTSNPSSRVLGNIDHYIPGTEPFENYLDRLEAFFAVNVSSQLDKVNSLIVLIGPEMYKTLKNLVLPSKPQEKSFEHLLGILKTITHKEN